MLVDVDGERCERPDCDETAPAGMRFCEVHAQDLEWMLGLLERPRCPRCGNLIMSEGILGHDCDNPAPQPPEAEML